MRARTRRRFRGVSAPFLAFVLTVGGCVSTPYKGSDPSLLSDDQLLTELESIYRQMGLATSSIWQLRTMMPREKLVLTAQSFTTFTGTVQTYGDSAFVSGMATTTTRYQTYDQNETQRQLNQLAQNIQMARINQLNDRRLQVESAIRWRITERQRAQYELELQVKQFFTSHPDLTNQVPLLQNIFPWAQKASTSATLEALAYEAESVLASKASGRPEGRWYGTLQFKRGSTSAPYTEIVRGHLKGGDEISLQLEDRTGGVILGAEGSVTETGVFSGVIKLSSWLWLDHVIFATGSVSASEVRFHLTDGSGFDGFLTLAR